MHLFGAILTGLLTLGAHATSDAARKASGNGTNVAPEWIQVAYFQGDNNRSCLTMDASRIPADKYNTIHFAFGTLTQNFTVELGRAKDQFATFKKQKGFRKVISFGGWGFSSSPSTYMIFRNMIQPQNQDIAAKNIADFVYKNKLDGADMDFEYPGEPDQPGIPPGEANEGTLYAEFLGKLKKRLPDRSLSVAMAASNWYLKGFDVPGTVKAADYIIFMSYDFHGLFDYGSQYSQDGCVGGNCLRSHVNLTETLAALDLIQSKGAPANKLVVGASSYGRGFHYAKAGCYGPMCTWTKNATQPMGNCTAEAGVMANAEIDRAYKQAKQRGSTAVKYFDKGSGSDVAVVGDWWLAYLSEQTKADRARLFRSKGYRGTTDWSVDLQKFGLEKPLRGN